jgi:hypothetical protein
VHALLRLPRGAALSLAGTGARLAAAAVVAAVVALATLPVSAPWSPGQALWPGMLLGAAAVILAGWLECRAAGAPREAPPLLLAASGGVGAAAAACGVLAALYPLNPLIPPLGLAGGALLAGVLLAAGGGGREEAEQARGQLALQVALAVAAVAAATHLAGYHRSPLGVREWVPLPALILAAGALGLAAAGQSRRLAGHPAAAGAVSLVPALGVGAVAALRLGGTPGLLWALLAGAGSLALAALLEHTLEGERGPGDAGSALLGGLLAIGGALLAFRARHGLGLGAAAIAGVLLLPPLLASRRAAVAPPRGSLLVTAAVAFLVTAALYRALAERGDAPRAVQPDFFYYHAAWLGGALLPAVLGGLAARGASAAGAWAALWPATAGLLALLATGALWLTVGDLPLAAFVVGAGGGMLLLPALRHAEGPALAPAALLGPGMAVAALHAATLLAPLALRTRGERVLVLLGCAVLAVLALALTAALARAPSSTARTR